MLFRLAKRHAYASGVSRAGRGRDNLRCLRFKQLGHTKDGLSCHRRFPCARPKSEF